jgi:2-polyprenyl-6-methoxyphenol hydroxylase-like FAD-dependent oxidoreductase
MVRLYIQIASSTDADWNPRKTATEEEVQASAKKILQPYLIEWEKVVWYSVYPIGQGISDRYTLDHRVFLGGDACHTHSVCHICPHLSDRACADVRVHSPRLAKA